MDDRDRRAPVALARHAPVAQPPHRRPLAPAFRLGAGDHFADRVLGGRARRWCCRWSGRPGGGWWRRCSRRRGRTSTASSTASTSSGSSTRTWTAARCATPRRASWRFRSRTRRPRGRSSGWWSRCWTRSTRAAGAAVQPGLLRPGGRAGRGHRTPVRSELQRVGDGASGPGAFREAAGAGNSRAGSSEPGHRLDPGGADRGPDAPGPRAPRGAGRAPGPLAPARHPRAAAVPGSAGAAGAARALRLHRRGHRERRLPRDASAGGARPSGS